MDTGRQKGFVTYDDILRFFPEAERDVDQLDEAHAALLAAGIEVVDSVDTDEPTDDDMDDTEAEVEELLEDYLHAFGANHPAADRDAVLTGWKQQHSADGQLLRLQP